MYLILIPNNWIFYLFVDQECIYEDIYRIGKGRQSYSNN
jgi:hypothetical protein